MDIQGSSAIITGGASGLGEATARASPPTASRVTVFDKNEERAKQVAADIGAGANFVGGDVTDPDDCQKAVDQAAEGGNLRIAVNCAGTGWVGRVINRDGSPHDLAPFQFIQNLNVIGTFNVMTKAASAMSTVEPQANGERGRHRQHRLGRRLRRPDRPVGLLRLQRGHRGHDPSGRPRPGRGRHPGAGHRPRPVRHAAAGHAPRRAPAPPWPSRSTSPSAWATRPSSGELVVQIAPNSYLNAEVIRLDGGIRMPPK